MKSFNLKIVTPDGICYTGEVESLLVHTETGDVEFLAGHIDFIGSLTAGRVRIKENGRDRLAAGSGGTVAFTGGAATLAAVTFEFSENIDLERAMRAKEAAEERIKTEKNTNRLLLAEAKLQRALLRIKIANTK